MINTEKQRHEKMYIFLDESGKPEIFSTRGENLVSTGKASKYLIISAVRTEDQLKLQQDITSFRSSLLHDESLKRILSASYTLDTFHAHNDYPEVRERFYTFINEIDIKIDLIAVEKLKCFESLQRNPGRMYGIMTGQLLKDLCHHAKSTEIIFSRKDSKLKLRNELEREVERVRLEYLQDHPNLDTKLHLAYHHNPHFSHGGLQVADYVSYAVFQVFENNKRNLYEMIKDKIGKIHDICNKKYFTRSNPL